MSQVQPEHFIRRSPLYRTLIKFGAQFEDRFNNACVTKYSNNNNQELIQAENLGLIDLSSLPRTGFKGKEAIQWAKAQELNIGDLNNQAYLQENGALVARLADTEILILNDLYTNIDQCKEFDKKHHLEKPTKCFTVPRVDSSAWFMITGAHSVDMFSKICGIDLRSHKFLNGSIAQTSIARINGTIIRMDLNTTTAFHLLFDSASSEYMWSCLIDAFVEFDGSPIGLNTLLKQ